MYMCASYNSLYIILIETFCWNRVQNVKQVLLKSAPPFPSHKDHSKWAIAVATTAATNTTATTSFLQENRVRQQQQPWVCIGDINRMVQYDGDCVFTVTFNLCPSPNLLTGFHLIQDILCPIFRVARKRGRRVFSPFPNASRRPT